jgi:Transmembrane secretion effector
VSVLGNQLTMVAVPYQVYQLTRSSLAVGLVSMTQLFPLIAGSLLGGSVVDAMDRRRLLMAAQVLMAACSAGLAVNTDLWHLVVAAVRAAGPGGRVQRPGQRRAQRHRAASGTPVRARHRERHVPGPVPDANGGRVGDAVARAQEILARYTGASDTSNNAQRDP